MGGPIGSRNPAAEQHKKSENKRKKELKALKKQNKMLYSIAKKSSSPREIKKIKKIRAEAIKETNSSSEDWDYDSSLSSDIKWDKDIRPAGSKYIKKIDHAVMNNIMDYNDQNNEANDNELTLDNSSFSLSK